MSHKEKQIFFQIYRRFRKKKGLLHPSAEKELRSTLQSLQHSLLSSQTKEAKKYSSQALELSSKYLRKTALEKWFDTLFAVLFALILATIIRQSWFELYEIPTGSMRPTLEEKYRVLVSKTAFGINIPLKVDHAYFDPNLIQRNAIVTFTSANLDIPDTDTRYFYLFPGKKQFVKRLIGKPGDLLYFYGGKIYGLDANGHSITEQFATPALDKIDHIPFLRFEGQLSYPSTPIHGVYPVACIHQMGEKIALLDLAHGGRMLPYTYTYNPHFQQPELYGSLWGIDNFAMARLLTQEEAMAKGATEKKEASLYLELTHHPRLDHLHLVNDRQGKLRPGFNYEISLLPLQEEDIKTLFSNLYTARFQVKKGTLTRYGIERSTTIPEELSPHIPEIPDGTYEFYYGKAYRIGFEGILEELKSDHPLYTQTIERLLIWFNLGIDFNNLYKPSSRTAFPPLRYAYFREGDLYVMGAPLWKKNNPHLSLFLQEEMEKQNQGDYLAFVDAGPPTRERMKRYGLKVPEKQYLVLGDNHAMSADSRVFGCVPEENLKGSPSLIFWPYGKPFGALNQPFTRFITFPNMVAFGLVGLFIGLWFLFRYLRQKLPVKDL